MKKKIWKKNFWKKKLKILKKNIWIFFYIKGSGVREGKKPEVRNPDISRFAGLPDRTWCPVEPYHPDPHPVPGPDPHSNPHSNPGPDPEPGPGSDLNPDPDPTLDLDIGS